MNYKSNKSEINSALYAGTFDVFTNGHYDIVERALRIFDELTILIAIPPKKKSLLSKEVRMEMLHELYGREPRIRIEFWSGLIVDYAKENGIQSIVRGLRPTGDFEIEYQMASMNRQLHADVDTVFLMAGKDNYYISSSLVKEVLSHGGDITKFVPKEIGKRLEKFKGIVEE